MTGLQQFFFGVFPYICLTAFVVGHIWRYRYDQFGWTTRSSQWYESRLLQWASPMFHLGLLGVLAGHLVGLVIPATWTDAMGISDSTYHLVAVALGSVAGAVMVVGLVGLVYRRRTTPAVFRATTRMDKAMYLVLGLVIVLGLVNTVGTQVLGGGYDYRESVALWFRSIFTLSPDVTAMTESPWSFQLHAISAFALLALWPFTRLVHVLSAPFGYLVRPYVVYRSRGDAAAPGSRDPRPGWEPSTLKHR